MEEPRVLVLNGPNLHKLGDRETDVYGSNTLKELTQEIESSFPNVRFEFFQSDIEGELIKRLHEAEGYAGIVLNAGGFSHTSVAIRDAIACISEPVIEVHLSNLLAREPFRHTSIIGGVCTGSIMGFGIDSYKLAIAQLLKGHSGS